MGRTAARYYPAGSDTPVSEPESCYCGNRAGFRKLHRRERNDTRYMCISCKGSYMVRSPEADRLRLERMGRILDSMILGMSSRQTCLRIFVDWGHVVRHPTILSWSRNYVQYAKMLTDDILCYLEYGRVWGIDETVMDIRGRWHGADPDLLSQMRTIETEKGDGLLSDAEFRKEWEKIRARAERSRRSPRKKWLSAVVDLKTRVIIHYIVTDRRPDHGDIYRLVRTATIIAGMPTDVITDCYSVTINS